MPAISSKTSTTNLAEPLTLPNPRHANRVPPHIGPQQLGRIRQAAYTLPQVVKPADFVAEHSAGFEEHLDKLGLVLLQKAAGGARPSRWIAPELMDSALAHLDSVGTGPTARSLVQERTGVLDALGVSRHAGSWTRLISQALHLSEPGWRVPVVFRVPVEAEPVWAYFRNGDKAALLAALGPAPAYPHAAELAAHLEALIERSRSYKPRHLESLLPRLQTECAAPHTTERFKELKAACTRAQDRWEHRVTELDTLEGLNSELAFQGYPDTFEKARHLPVSYTHLTLPTNREV